jgi:hypothetical protein
VGFAFRIFSGAEGIGVAAAVLDHDGGQHGGLPPLRTSFSMVAGY